MVPMTPSISPPVASAMPASEAASSPGPKGRDATADAETLAALPFAGLFLDALVPAPEAAILSAADLHSESEDLSATGNPLPLVATLPPSLLTLPTGLPQPAALGPAPPAGEPVLGLRVLLGGAGQPLSATPRLPALAVAVGAPDPATTDGLKTPWAAFDLGPAQAGDVAWPINAAEVPGQEIPGPECQPGSVPFAGTSLGPAGPGQSSRTVPAPLPTPLGDPQWAPAMSERVAWLVEGNVKHAELRLNPPELGPLEVHIAMVDDEARITFTAHHAAVREAVEAALPRLREMLGSSGVSLVQVDVSAQGGRDQRAPGEPGGQGGPSAGPRGRGGIEGDMSALPGRIRGVGLFDAYA